MSKYNDNSDNMNLWTNRKLLLELNVYVLVSPRSRDIVAIIKKRFVRHSSKD